MNETRQIDIPVFKNEPVMVLILSFITCGLYLIYWNLKMAEVVNHIVERESISPLVAILSGCCVPANLYFYWLVGQELETIGKKTGNESFKDQSILLLILGFFFPFVAAMIVQGEINKLYD